VLVVRKAAVRRSELTDGVWERIAPLLPENGRRGKQWKDHRMVVCRNPLVYAPAPLLQDLAY
jgi:transposase